MIIWVSLYFIVYNCSLFPKKLSIFYIFKKLSIFYYFYSCDSMVLWLSDSKGLSSTWFILMLGVRAVNRTLWRCIEGQGWITGIAHEAYWVCAPCPLLAPSAHRHNDWAWAIFLDVRSAALVHKCLCRCVYTKVCAKQVIYIYVQQCLWELCSEMRAFLWRNLRASGIGQVLSHWVTP